MISFSVKLWTSFSFSPGTWYFNYSMRNSILNFSFCLLVYSKSTASYILLSGYCWAICSTQWSPRRVTVPSALPRCPGWDSSSLPRRSGRPRFVSVLLGGLPVSCQEAGRLHDLGFWQTATRLEEAPSILGLPRHIFKSCMFDLIKHFWFNSDYWKTSLLSGNMVRFLYSFLANSEFLG